MWCAWVTEAEPNFVFSLKDTTTLLACSQRPLRALDSSFYSKRLLSGRPSFKKLRADYEAALLDGRHWYRTFKDSLKKIPWPWICNGLSVCLCTTLAWSLLFPQKTALYGRNFISIYPFVFFDQIILNSISAMDKFAETLQMESKISFLTARKRKIAEALKKSSFFHCGRFDICPRHVLSAKFSLLWPVTPPSVQTGATHSIKSHVSKSGRRYLAFREQRCCCCKPLISMSSIRSGQGVRL